ncbi:MAG: hypothetical protein ABEH64_00805 [Salinirussus sp.]
MSEDEQPDDSAESDPFDDLEAEVGEREGDPFADLGEETADVGEKGQQEEDSQASEPAVETETDPTPSWPSPGGGAESEQEEPEDSSPFFSDMDEQPGDVDEPIAADEQPGDIDEPIAPDEEPASNDPFSSASPDFEEIDIGGADEDEIWEALSAAHAAGSVADVREQTYAEVSKHSYCEQCEYFTGPPETTCTHEGTRITEFVDMKTVRVVDCPIVAERRRLEREH